MFVLKKWYRFSFLLMIIGMCACSSTVKELRVRVPTSVHYDLSRYNRMCVFDFLVYEDFENLLRDVTIDYGHEIQQLIRNELQNSADTMIYDVRPTVFKKMSAYKKERMQGKTTSLRKETPIPEIKFWTKDENARQWIEEYLVNDCLKSSIQPEEQKLSWFYGGHHPFIRQAEVSDIGTTSDENEHGTAILFGILEMRGVRGLLAGPGLSAREVQQVPGTIQSNTYGTRIKYGVRIFLYDVDEKKILYSNFQQTTITLPYSIDKMELTFFYAPMDRIMPKLLSPLVPVYINTRRSLVRPSYPSSKGAVP